MHLLNFTDVETRLPMTLGAYLRYMLSEVNVDNWVMAAADVEKFRVVFDMCDAGVRMYRQRMRRENPPSLR